MMCSLHHHERNTLNLRSILATIILAVACNGAAFAWPACSGQWVSVPKTTVGGTLYSTGDLLFQCQTKQITLTPSSSASSSSASSVATSQASSSAAANQKQSQGQSQTANGGNANAIAANNGNNSNNSVTNVAAPDIPVSTAYAPSSFPTAPCFKGYGAGVQTAPFGASFGGGKIDENCASLEAARQAPSLIARCKVYVSNKYVKRAGVTLADCLMAEKKEVPTIPVTVTQYIPMPAPPAPVVVELAPIVIDVYPPKPAPVKTQTAKKAKPCPTLEK
jgi:hypothetical protein